MFKKILVPTDGSELSQQAVNCALNLAQESDAKVVTISIAEPYPFLAPTSTSFMPEVGYNEDLQRLHGEESFRLAHEYVKQVVNTGKELGVSCEAITAISFKPHEEIIKAVDKHNCDLIVMASHGKKGISQLFVGSETQKVLANSKVPVLIIR